MGNLTEPKKSKLYLSLLLLFFVFLLLWSSYGILVVGTSWERVGTLQQLWRAVTRFFPPNWPYVLELGKATFDTFLIALLGTFLALVLAIPVAWFAASNISIGVGAFCGNPGTSSALHWIYI